MGISRITSGDCFRESVRCFLKLTFSKLHCNVSRIKIECRLGVSKDLYEIEDKVTLPKNQPALSCSQKCHTYCPIPNLLTRFRYQVFREWQLEHVRIGKTVFDERRRLL